MLNLPWANLIKHDNPGDDNARGLILNSKVEGWFSTIVSKVNGHCFVQSVVRRVIWWYPHHLTIVADSSWCCSVLWWSFIDVCVECTLTIQSSVTVWDSLFKLYHDTDLRQPCSIHCPVDELCDQPVVLWTNTEPTHLDCLTTWISGVLNPLSHV